MRITTWPLPCLLAVVMSACNSLPASDDDAHTPRAPGPQRALDSVSVPPLIFAPNVYLVPAAAGAQQTPGSVVIGATAALSPGAAGAAAKLAGDLVVGDYLVNDYGAP